MRLVVNNIVLILTVVLFVNCGQRRNTESADDPVASTRIVIDGFFEDWDSVEIGVDDRGDAPGAEFDLGTIRTQHDSVFVHVMISLDRKLNLQGLDGSLSMNVDVDGNSATGIERDQMAGVDLVVQFTPPSEDQNSRGMGIGVFSTFQTSTPASESPPIGHADLGFKMAPTYASQHVEFSMSRTASLSGIPALFQGRSFALKFVLSSEDGTVTEQTDVLTHALNPLTAGKRDPPGLADVPSRDDDAPRLLSWNIANGTLLKETAIYERILKLLNPDILLLQELTPDDTADAILSFLNRRVTDGDPKWQVVVGATGAYSGCGIASRFPIEPIPALTQIPHPDRRDHFVRAVGGAVTLTDGKRLFVASIHLKCCGRIGSEEDQTRLAEIKLINQSIKAAMAEGRFEGIVIGGDLNLVGSYEPIKTLAAGLDIDQSDLAVLQPYRLDRRSNATWENARSRFAPGRLDYVLMSEGSLVENESFVFNSGDLSRERLTHYSLNFDDSSAASDHFPIVVDLNWRDSAHSTNP